MHGLWAWNWADSHRPLLSIRGSNITVGGCLSKGGCRTTATATATN